MTTREQHPPGLLAERHGEHAGGGGEFELDALGLQRQHRTVDAERPADGRQRGAADHLGQAVVAAAAADRGLRAEPVVDELEGRAGVVVEAADQLRVVLEGDARRGEQLAHLLVVRLARVAQVVAQQRRAGQLLLDVVALVVEDPQRVDLDAAPGVLVEVEAAQEVLERGPVDGAALLVAQRVEQDAEVPQAERAVRLVAPG